MTSDDNVSVITEASNAALCSNPLMCQEDRHYTYKSLISDIAESLNDGDVKNIIWRYAEDLPAAMKQKGVLEVLQHLHENRKLSEWKVENLRSLLLDLKRNDLVEKVEHFQQQYPAERHSSLPADTSNPRIALEKQRANTCPESQLNSLRSTLTTNPQQESGFNETGIDPQNAGDSTMSPGSEVHSRQSTAMGHYPQSGIYFQPQPVMGYEPMSAPVQQFPNHYAERPVYKFSSGTTTPGSISASSFDMIPTMQPHSNRSRHSSAHASFENFSHPSTFSLSSGDSHPHGYVHPHPTTPSGHPLPWYNSHSSLPNTDFSPHLPRYNHSRSVMTMPGRPMTANPSMHSRRHARRHTINSMNTTGLACGPNEVQYLIERGIDPRLAYDYPHPDYSYQPQASAEDVYQNGPYSNGGYSHSQPSNRAHHFISQRQVPQPNYTAAIVPQQPLAGQIFHRQVKERAWGSGDTSEHSNRLSIPPSRQSQSAVLNSNWEEDYNALSDKQSKTSHYTTSTEHAQSNEYNYPYESDGSEDSAEGMVVYRDDKQKEDLLENLPTNQVILRNKDRKRRANQSSKRYSLQPVSHSDEKKSSVCNKRRSLSGGWVDEQPHLLSKPSEDTLVGSPNGSLQARSVRSQPHSKGSTDDTLEEKYRHRSDKPMSHPLNNGATNIVPTKKQRIPKSLFTRSRLYKPHEELVWRVKRDKLNKMIYKHKDKYIACSDKIELETDRVGPHPKLILRLHSYGIEEDQNENVTLEVRIERSKKTGSGSMHSSTKVEVCVRGEDVDGGRVIGGGRKVRESVRSSFFFIKRFISHQELKKSRSEYIEIRATAKLVFPL